MSLLSTLTMKKLGLSVALAIGACCVSPSAQAGAAAVPGLQSAWSGDQGATEVHYRGGRGYYGGGYGYYGGYYRPPVYLYAAPPVVYSYQYSGGHCAWLHRKARETGSRTWWNRYRREC